MNRDQRARLAAYLFDEIGNIDDRFVAEAETPYERQSRSHGMRRFAILAVSLSLALTATLGIFVGSRLLGSKKNDASRPENDNEAVVTDIVAGHSTSAGGLSARLESMRDKTEHCRTEAEQIDLLSSEPSLILKYAEEENYRVCPITHEQRDRLLREMNQNAGTPVSPDGATATAVKVWIVTGDGTVLSPCLEQTDGNVGYGTLFDYEPELEPSQAFTETLCGILS